MNYKTNFQKSGKLSLVIPGRSVGLRLDLALQQLLPEYSRSRLQAWIKAGHVTINAKACTAKQVVWGGEAVEVIPQILPEVVEHEPQAIALDIVYEDTALMVVNKPAGLVTHPGSGNWQGTLLNALLHHAPGLKAIPRAGIVHRLDKDTSGLMVIAKTLTAQTDLVRQMQSRQVIREYLALVYGDLKGDGEIALPIGRHPTQRTKMAVVEKGKPALTRYKVLKRHAGLTLVRCSLQTGRTHQIRVHMHFKGHPLVGDPTYKGNPGAVPGAVQQAARSFKRQALHAVCLKLAHPVTGQAMHWEISLPEDMAQLLRQLEVAHHA